MAYARQWVNANVSCCILVGDEPMHCLLLTPNPSRFLLEMQIEKQMYNLTAIELSTLSGTLKENLPL